MIKKISIALSVILCVGLVIAIKLSDGRQKKAAALVEEMNNRIAGYNVTIAELNAKIKELQKDTAVVNKGCATVQFVLTEPIAAAGNELPETLSALGIKGIAALTIDDISGKSGSASAEMLQMLSENGFKFCYYFRPADALNTTADGFAQWLEKIKNAAADNGIKAENVVFFEDGSFDEEYIDELKNGEILAAVHHGESYFDELSAEEEKGIVFCGARGIGDTEKCYSIINEYGGNLTVEVSGDCLRTHSPAELFKSESDRITQSNVNVTDFEEMLRTQKGNRMRLEQSADTDETVGRYRDRIKELEETVKKIESEYTDRIDRMKK